MKFLLLMLIFSLQVYARDYPATILVIKDGDTVECRIDLGLGIFKAETIRLNGIDAPEMSTAEGKAAKKELEQLLQDKQVIISTANDKREKFGRLLGVVVLNGINVNQLLIKKGLVKSYDGAKR